MHYQKRTFVLLILRELPLERAVDHASQAVLDGSRTREVRISGDIIDPPCRGRFHLGGEAPDEEDSYEDIGRRENGRRSDPHCNLEKRTREKVCFRVSESVAQGVAPAHVSEHRGVWISLLFRCRKERESSNIYLFFLLLTRL